MCYLITLIQKDFVFVSGRQDMIFSAIINHFDRRAAKYGETSNQFASLGIHIHFIFLSFGNSNICLSIRNVDTRRGINTKWELDKFTIYPQQIFGRSD